MEIQKQSRPKYKLKANQKQKGYMEFIKNSSHYIAVP